MSNSLRPHGLQLKTTNWHINQGTYSENLSMSFSWKENWKYLYLFENIVYFQFQMRWSRCISSYSSYLIEKLDIINRRFWKVWRSGSARNFRAWGTAQLLVPWSFFLPPYIPDWIQSSPPFQKLAIKKCWWVKAKIGQEKPLFSQRTMKVTAWKDRKMIWWLLQIITSSS